MRSMGIATLLVLGSACVAACGHATDDASRSGPYELRVTGSDFAWHVQYPGPDRVLDTPDDVHRLQHIRVPADTDVTIHLQSSDYIYTFYVPDFDQKQIAVPDMEFAVSFRTPEQGTYSLLGSQMCGYDHPNLLGTIVVDRADARQTAHASSAGFSARGAE